MEGEWTTFSKKKGNCFLQENGNAVGENDVTTLPEDQGDRDAGKANCGGKKDTNGIGDAMWVDDGSKITEHSEGAHGLTITGHEGTITEPLYPPGFEPGQSAESTLRAHEPEYTSQQEEERIGGTVQNSESTKLRENADSKRITRSAVKLLDKRNESVDTWELGKKLGMFTECDEAVIKELANGETTGDNRKQRKRGRPRKSQN